MSRGKPRREAVRRLLHQFGRRRGDHRHDRMIGKYLMILGFTFARFFQAKGDERSIIIMTADPLA